MNTVLNHPDIRGISCIEFVYKRERVYVSEFTEIAHVPLKKSLSSLTNSL